MTNDAKPVDEIKDERARNSLPDLCADYRELQNQIAALEAAKKVLIADIENHAKRARLTKVSGDGWLLLRSKSTYSKISKEKLVEKGVKLSVIAAATESTEKVYYKVLGRNK